MSVSLLAYLTKYVFFVLEHLPNKTTKFSSMIQRSVVSTFSRLILDVGANLTSSSPISVTDTLVAFIDAVTHLKNDLKDISSVLFNLRTFSDILPNRCVSALSPIEIAIIFADFLYLLFQRAIATEVSSVGVPSVKRNIIGFQSPFCSSVVFTSSLSILSIRKFKAAPKDVPPPIGNVGG